MANEHRGNGGLPTLREPQGVPAGAYAADEISLFDLWDVLVRRRWWMAGVLLVTAFSGLGYLLIKEPEYEYTHTIEIGNRLVGEELHPIESAKSAAAKFEQNYLPSAIHAWLDANPDAQWRPEIDASVPSDADIVVLNGTGTERRGQAYRAMLVAATDRLRSDHKRIIDTIRQQLMVGLAQAKTRVEFLQNELKGIRGRFSVDIEEARSELGDLEDTVNVAAQELRRLDRREELLRDEIDDLQSNLTDAEKARKQATGDPKSAADAMTLLMLAEEVRATRRRLSSLRIQLDVDLANDRDQLASRIAGLQRQFDIQAGEIGVLEARRDAALAAKQGEIEVQQGNLKTYEIRLENLSGTQPLSEPQQSLRPVGAGNMTIAALSVVLGGMLGVFAAFFAEFVHAANRRRRTMGAGDAQP